ncbi:MAG TPA: ATP-binding protein, partial [Acidobacteriota bacterium]|nr:ATP-binding protein [Acidobacteriota bacterium]
AGAWELQELARAFNTMAGDLRTKIHSIRQEHARTEALLSRMVEGVLAIDRRGKAVFANAAFCQMIGLPLERIRGRSFLEITRNDQLSGYLSQLLAAAGKGSIEAALLEPKEIRFGRQEGESIFSVQASLISDEGNETLVLLVFHDITRTKMVEQIRKDFVDNVSHELRTPLTALKGSIEILLDGAYLRAEESRKFLQIMNKQLSGVQNLVSDMLKLAAVEDVHVSIRRETVDVNAFLRDIKATMEPMAQRKNQSLSVQLPNDNVLLNIDPAQMADAVLNVIDNAIKYTQPGGRIEVEARVDPAGLLIRISDNGPGIAQDQIPRIFERFYRVDKSRSREVGGTGLGLSIAKHAVENHGGTITVQSEL